MHIAITAAEAGDCVDGQRATMGGRRPKSSELKLPAFRSTVLSLFLLLILLINVQYASCSFPVCNVGITLYCKFCSLPQYCLRTGKQV
jgi:hypothetical protein